MGIGTNIKYNYKELAESFFKNVVVRSAYNTKYYYRFTTTLLNRFLTVETDNDWIHLDGDIQRLVSGTLYHLKKMGFRKTRYPRQYKLLKNKE